MRRELNHHGRNRVRISSVRLVRPRNTRKRTLCGTEMAVEWVFHAFQPMIAHPKTSVYGRWTYASELPEGILHAAFCVPRMRASVCSVVDILRKLLTPGEILLVRKHLIEVDSLAQMCDNTRT